MWFTLLIIFACLIGIPLGGLFLLLALVVLLPIHIGGSGYYREDAYAAVGWAKVLAGLVGVVFEYTENGGQIQVVLGKWVLWQPKETTEDVPLQEEQSEERVSKKTGAKSEPVLTKSDPRPLESTGTIQKIETVAPTVSGKSPSAQQASKAETDTSFKTGAPLPQLPPANNQKKKPSLWSRWQIVRVQIDRYLDYWQEAWPILARFLKRLTHILGFRYVDIDVTFGASDPAQTGQLFGYVEAVRPLLGKRARLVLTPDFTQSRLEGAGGIEVSFYLFRLFWAVIALVVRGGILGGKIWWRERRAKRIVGLKEV